MEGDPRKAEMSQKEREQERELVLLKWVLEDSNSEAYATV